MNSSASIYVPPVSKYTRRLGFYLGCLLTLLLIVGGVVLLLLRDAIKSSCQRIWFAASIFWLAGFGFIVLVHPRATAGKGTPWLLNLIFGFNVILANAFKLVFEAGKAETPMYDTAQATGIGISFGLGALIVTGSVRLVLGLADDGDFEFLRCLKPWRLTATTQEKSETV